MRSLGLSILLLSATFVGAQDKPVPLPASELAKVKVFEREFRVISPAESGATVKMGCGGLFENLSDYEIDSLTLEMQVFDPEGRSVEYRQDVVLKNFFRNIVLDYRGSMLPKSRSQALREASFPKEYASRSYWIVIKSAEGYKSSSNLSDIGRLFAEIDRGHTANVETFIKSHPQLATIASAQKAVSPIHIAALYGRLDLVKFLHSMGADLSQQTDNGDRPIHFAAACGDIPTIKYLVSQHVDLNAFSKSDYGQSAVNYAAKFDKFEALEVLIKAGAKIDLLPAPFGVSALTTAIYWGSFNSFKVLLKHHANPNILSPGQASSLGRAVQRGLVWVKLVVDAGADVNAFRSNTDHFTALHQAATEGKLDVISFLLAHGANPNVRDIFKRQPIDYAQLSHNDAAAEILRKAMSKQ